MSAAEAATDPKPSRASGLLALVRALIDYGRHLATTFRNNPHPFGAADIAVILAHITRGLLRAEALEARIIRDAARLDAPPAPQRPASHRQAPPTDTAAIHDTLVPGLDPRMPTPEQIAAWVRRRPIGAVIADICRDLGIMANHPLWRELSAVIIRYGGNLARLAKDICERAFRHPVSPWPLTLAPVLPSPASSGTDPP